MTGFVAWVVTNNFKDLAGTSRASEPWCLRRRTCKLMPFSHGLWQTGAILGGADLVGLGA